MIYYLLLPVILLFSFIHVSEVGNNRHRVLINLYCFFIILISGTRYLIGTDYLNYENIFYYINGFSSRITVDINNISGLEPGFILLNKMFGFSSDGFLAVNFVLVVITIYTFHLAIIKLPSKYQALAYFILVTHAFIFFMQNQVRQACAVSLFVYSIRYINECKFNRYIVINILSAITFHYSALITLPVYFVNRINLTKIRMIILLSIILPLSLLGFFNEILTSMVRDIGLYGAYLSSEFSEVRGLSAINVVSVLYFSGLIFFFDRITNESKILFIGLLLSCVASNFTLLERLSAYFMYAKVLFLPLLIYKVKNNNKVILVVSVLIYSIAMYFNAILINSGGNIPYRSLFERLI